MAIDAPQLIFKSLMFPLMCVDALPGLGFSYVFFPICELFYANFRRCVDLTAEILSGYKLCGELPTDWVKSN